MEYWSDILIYSAFLHEIGQIVEKSIFNDAFLHKTAVFVDKLFLQAPAMVCKPSGRACTPLVEWPAGVFADYGALEYDDEFQPSR